MSKRLATHSAPSPAHPHQGVGGKASPRATSRPLVGRSFTWHIVFQQPCPTNTLPPPWQAPPSLKWSPGQEGLPDLHRDLLIRRGRGGHEGLGGEGPALLFRLGPPGCRRGRPHPAPHACTGAPALWADDRSHRGSARHLPPRTGPGLAGDPHVSSQGPGDTSPVSSGAQLRREGRGTRQ